MERNCLIRTVCAFGIIPFCRFPTRPDLKLPNTKLPMAFISRSINLVVLILILISGCAHAFKVPFRVNDVLPILPRQVSWPLLSNLHSAVDLLPSFVGSVLPDGGSVAWKGACFFENEARLEFAEGDRGNIGLGGGILHLKV